MLRNLKQLFFARNINNSNRKRFWKTMKYLIKELPTIPSLKADSVYADNDVDKANVEQSLL